MKAIKTEHDRIEIKIISSKRELKEFIFLPRILHKNHKAWVPPVYRDEWDYFNPKKNQALQYCDTILLTCRKSEQPVGRILGIVNHRYNECTNTRNGRFSMFDCIQDPDVAKVLLSQVENWAQEKGMKKLIGPMGMYYHDAMGFIIDGFEHKPAVSTNINFSYIPDLVTQSGYTKDKDLMVYKVDLLNSLPENYQKLHQRIAQKTNVTIKTFKSKSELRKAIFPILSLMNECFAEIYGYAPLDKKEMMDLAKKYLIVLNPKLVKVAFHGDQMVGFIVGMPNLSEGFRASKGFLFPFGIFMILRAAKKSTQLDLLIGGIKKKFQGIGIDVLLGDEIVQTGRKLGFKIMDSNLELEENVKMRAEMRKIGGVLHKKYRIFQKSLK